jgi:hypothetical protein
VTSKDAAGFAALCAEVCPGFSPLHRVAARKSELLAGTVGDTPAIAKRVARPSPVWEWYLRRELAIYRAFEATPPAFRVPRLLAADADRGVLVIERIAGPRLASRRRPAAALSAADIAAFIELHAQIAAWPGTFPADPPPPAVERQLRARLLEDPTAPRDWFHDGMRRCATRNLFPDPAAAALADTLLLAHATIAPSHGDLLLRNALRDGSRICLVDWECAGPHLADWDLALLYIQLAPEPRSLLLDEIRRGPRHREPTFFALVVFALARELSFLRSSPGPANRSAHARLRAELADACAELVG